MMEWWEDGTNEHFLLEKLTNIHTHRQENSEAKVKEMRKFVIIDQKDNKGEKKTAPRNPRKAVNKSRRRSAGYLISMLKVNSKCQWAKNSWK